MNDKTIFQDLIHVRTIRKTWRDENTPGTFDHELQDHLNREKAHGYNLKKIEWAKEPQGQYRMLIEAIVITEKQF